MGACLTQAKKIVDLQASLAQAKDSLNKITGKNAIGRALPLPSVGSTYGEGHHLTAVLDWPNGDALVVHRGDAIPGHYRVTSITLGTVVVSGPGGKHVLLMSGGVSGSAGNSGNSGNGTYSGMPGGVMSNPAISRVAPFDAQGVPGMTETVHGHPAIGGGME